MNDNEKAEIAEKVMAAVSTLKDGTPEEQLVYRFITVLWEDSQTMVRMRQALSDIRFAGLNDHPTAIWMQKVAAHAMDPEQWPAQQNQPPKKDGKV